MPAINWLAVLVAAISAFVLGGLWYGPLLGKAWMAGSGMTEDRAKQGSAGKIFGIAFVLELIAAAVLAMFLGAEATAAFGAAAGAAAGAFWVARAFGVVYLFEHRPFGHWAVNAGYQIVAYTLMGVIIGAWP
jgi:hypothetical protein